MEIWEPKPPGTLWATPGLLRDTFTCIIITEENNVMVDSEELTGTTDI